MDINSLDIKTWGIADLEKLVTEYPWFTYARHTLLVKLAETGREYMEVHLKKCSAFLSSREKLYFVAEGAVQGEAPVIDFEEINRRIDQVKAAPEVKAESFAGQEETTQSPQYIIVGGDYFTRDDLAGIEVSEPFVIGKLGSAEDKKNNEDAVKQEFTNSESLDELDDFYTETLAGIYAEQGYYEEAIKVYAKLILLYPEKSTYFATLVNKIKSKNN